MNPPRRHHVGGDPGRHHRQGADGPQAAHQPGSRRVRPTQGHRRTGLRSDGHPAERQTAPAARTRRRPGVNGSCSPHATTCESSTATSVWRAWQPPETGPTAGLTQYPRPVRRPGPTMGPTRPSAASSPPDADPPAGPISRLHGEPTTALQTHAPRSSLWSRPCYNAALQERSRSTVWLTGCRSWYLDASGNNRAMWPGSTVGDDAGCYCARTWQRLRRHPSNLI